jgi:hypothetical protein
LATATAPSVPSVTRFLIVVFCDRPIGRQAKSRHPDLVDVRQAEHQAQHCRIGQVAGIESTCDGLKTWQPGNSVDRSIVAVGGVKHLLKISQWARPEIRSRSGQQWNPT